MKLVLVLVMTLVPFQDCPEPQKEPVDTQMCLDHLQEELDLLELYEGMLEDLNSIEMSEDIDWDI